jgi:hypothetical protein
MTTFLTEYMSYAGGEEMCREWSIKKKNYGGTKG